MKAHTLAAAIGALWVAAAAGSALAAGTANGTLAYKARGAPMSIALKYAWLVKGPDAVDQSKTIRKLIFSSVDLDAKISACKTMNCTDADLGSGMTVDLDAGPRLNYWIVLDGQKVQYSGTARPETLKLSTDSPTKLAGKSP